MNRLVTYIALAALAASCASGGGSDAPASPVEQSPAEPDYDRTVAAARGHAERGRSERALELAERAVAMDPSRPEAYLVHGLALAQAGKLNESAAHYEMARERGSKSRRLYVELASVYDVAQKYDQAVRVYRDFLAMNPDDPEMRQELGLTLLLLRQFDEAVAELRTVSGADPTNLQARLDLGYALLQAGEADEAAGIFAPVVKEHGDRNDVKLLLARARAAQGRATEAIALLDAAIAATPSEVSLRMRARLYLLTGRVDAAAQDYKRLLNAKPGDPAVLLGYSGVLIALGELDRAAELLTRVRSAVKDHPVLRFRTAQVEWRRGERPAVEALAAFARDNPTDVEAWREVHAAAKKFKNKKLKKEAAAKLEALGDL